MVLYVQNWDVTIEKLKYFVLLAGQLNMIHYHLLLLILTYICDIDLMFYVNRWKDTHV